MTRDTRELTAAGVPRTGATTRAIRRRWLLRRWGLPLVDGALLCLGVTLATLARYDGNWSSVDVNGLLTGSVVVLVIFALFSVALRVHQARHPVGSVDELAAVGAGVSSAFIGLFALEVVSSAHWVPRSVPLLAAAVSFVFVLGVRLAVRRQRENAARPRDGRRTLVFGAGDAGHQLVRSMLGQARSPYLPVGILDDDPSKRHARVQGLRMLGGRESIADAARVTKASILVIALPMADAALIRELSGLASSCGLTVKVLPKVAELLDGRAGIRDVRDIEITDLLGRRQIDTNVAAVADYLAGKRVLVTGAGGSIGSELCRQIVQHAPAELIMLDRDESALHAVQLSIHGEACLDLPDVVLADIRDSESLQRIFAARRPDVVFHAAALKHVTMLEQYPDEAWKTNVLGTRNVLEAATSAGVSHFINVSTDKAADPINVLGRTKRLAEQLTATYAGQVSDGYLSVRFGNVLGSRGSVLMTFAAQIARGGPVTVTHPDVTRYFMTIPEAVELVIQAGAIGRGGEALVLDMGEPVRISDVARQLVEISGRDIDIVYTGLRPGEKLHEELYGQGETCSRVVHPLISHVPVPALEEWMLSRIGRRGGDIHEVGTAAASWVDEVVCR